MCGLTGFWDRAGSLSRDELSNCVQKMSDQIIHRGPDSSGIWCDENLGIAFGHRRLSIVDLSETGHQPMISASGRFVLSYNGEIYNASELRRELEVVNKGIQFKSNSDTEVILEACDFWGIEAACKRLIGMFAFSLWDREQKRLYLVRDRTGIKPLYWGYSKGVIFFGSQPKSFIPHPKWHPELDPNALTAYFRFNYIPTPLSIFKGIQKLKPGTILSINSRGEQDEICFWSLDKVVLDGSISRSSNRIYSEQFLIDELEMLLKDAVKRQMVADVKLGAFLSGGIDSSTIVALMQSQSNQAIKTFSIGFSEESYDEARHATDVAKHLGTEHHELYLDDSLAQGIIPEIPSWCDEPLADPSQIPTYFVSKLARQQVTVILSGDGGDELFGGYNRYVRGHHFWQKIRFLPKNLKQITAAGIIRLSPELLNKVMPVFSNKIRNEFSRDRLAKILQCYTSEDFYQMLVSKWDPPEELLFIEKEPQQTHPWNSNILKNIKQFIERMQYIDMLGYLPDYILAKMDRASMAVSLEARVPILDHRVIEFAWKLPLIMKYRQGQTKWLLRQVLHRYVPEHLVNRPKMGFDMPIEHWLRGSLREWAEYLLDPYKLKSEGILNPIPIQKRWREHMSREKNWHYSLWGVLMFQAWKEYWKI